MEPCLLIKQSSLRIIIMVNHVDYYFNIGNKASIQDDIQRVTQKVLELKVEEK